MGKSYCISLNGYEDMAIHSIFHIFILFIVLTAFFFIVVENIERKTLTAELVNGIHKGLNNIVMQKNQDAYEKLSKLASLYKNPEKSDIIYNGALFVICIGIIITLGLILLTLILTLKYSGNKCINMVNIILENLLLFICVGVVEYLFFINIGMNYVPIKPSYMTELINNELSE